MPGFPVDAGDTSAAISAAPSPAGRRAIGRRERKKAQTRQHISDAATRLFMERGFEAVTVADVAHAADVSIKTVFNHFGAKEELFFDREQELVDGVLATITRRPAGAPLLAGLRDLLRDNRIPVAGQGWAGLHTPEGFAGYRRFVATEAASPALAARRLTGIETLRRRLMTTLAAQLGLPEDDPVPVLLAGTLTALGHARERLVSSAVLAEAPAGDIEARARALVDDGFRRIEAAFPGTVAPAREATRALNRPPVAPTAAVTRPSSAP